MIIRICRILFAFLFAPLAAGLFVFMYAYAIALFTSIDAKEAFLNVGIFGIYGIIICYVVTAIFGIPLHLILSHVRLERKSVFILTHGVLGALGGLLFGIFFMGIPIYPSVENNTREAHLLYVTFIGGSGFSVASAFALIAGMAYTRPENTNVT